MEEIDISSVILAVNLESNPDSNFIKKITYSYLPKGESNICEKLCVHFKDGGHFEYTPPLIFSGDGKIFDFQGLYNEFISAESAGKFWHKKINNKYQLKVIKPRSK